jgi:hypothetical protein
MSDLAFPESAEGLGLAHKIQRPWRGGAFAATPQYARWARDQDLHASSLMAVGRPAI